MVLFVNSTDGGERIIAELVRQNHLKTVFYKILPEMRHHVLEY